MTEQQARQEILSLVKNYSQKYHKNKNYTCGDRIPYAARVFDDAEVCALVDSALDFWLTAGRYADKFEKEFSSYLGVKYTILVNSGSSANLLGFMTLTSPLLKDRAINCGDEVITVAAGFPTTVAPIIQFGAVPVFVDVDLPSYNIDVSKLEAAFSSKTKAVMLAHTLGNTFNIKAVKNFCDENGLWLIEDNCDALGSEYCLDGATRKTGTFGDIGTSSFYPPHYMTMGEGGAVYTNNPLLHKIMLSLRDWGRDCICPSGKDNFCGARFDGQYGELPKGYDHKYVYSHFGYNLKATDMQAAIGCEQLKKLDDFCEARRKNWKALKNGLSDLSDVFILPEPMEDSNPSWFGFLITLRDNCGIEREPLVRYLESKGIQTRMLFAGNLIKHPCFDEMRAVNSGYRVVGTLDNTDKIMKDTFWLGVYPGINEDMIKDIVGAVKGYVVG